VHLIYKIGLISLTTTLFASYYAKVEPIESYNIKADISGKVLDVNRSAISTNYKGIVIKIDDYQDRINLKSAEVKLKILKNILSSQKEILKRKKRIYETYQKLSSKSQNEKDLKFFDYQNSLIAYNQTKSNIADLEAKIKILKNSISKKNIHFNNYIYELYVNKGDYVTPANLVAKIMDLSKEKIYIYVPLNKINSIKNKKVYINGKKSNFKIAYIKKVADDKFVTSYKVKLVGNYPTISEIVKVDFK